MIRGRISLNFEAVTTLEVSGPSGQVHEIEAVVDTGFSDFLPLPPELISELAAPTESKAVVVLADGRPAEMDVCSVSLLWDGHWRHVDVFVANSSPLIGMALLENHSLRMEVVHGGTVTIEAIT